MKGEILNSLLQTAWNSVAVMKDPESTAISRLGAANSLEKALNAVKEDAEGGIQTNPRFNGAVYDPYWDDNRLSNQIGRIFDLMMDSHWKILAEISARTADPPASISAQLRHLRKRRFGSYVVEKRHRGARDKGLFEYRVLAPNGLPILPRAAIS